MATITASIRDVSPESITIALCGSVDTSNAATMEKDVLKLCEQAPESRLVLDFENLAYISSAGLRVIMRLLKKDSSLSVVNASSEVCDVLDMTGFTDLMDVRRALREISVEGLELLGSGANGDVYRLAKDTMVKVFRPTLSLDDIEEERRASRESFVLGVPCAIPFDTVRCGDCYGTVYEALDARTLTELIREDPSTLESYAARSARMLADLNAIEVPAGALPPAERWHHLRIDAIAAYFSENEVAEMHGLLQAIPPMSRFVHNDYHAKNIMESNGELMVIDLGEAGAGNPFLDIIHAYFIYNIMGGGLGTHADDDMSFIGLTYGELGRFWASFLPAYCKDEGSVERLNALFDPWGWFFYLSSSMGHPRLPEQYRVMYADRMRAQVLARADEMRSSLGEICALRGLA